MELTTVWFIAIAFFWTGYFVLEGFDFGVGMLMPILGRNDVERRVVLNTIGPVWDANEVWLIVAVGATFAAFPEWYATMFSGLYLLVLVIVLSMILRVVGIDFRSKRTDPSWRSWCDWGIFIGSIVPAFFWGVTLANLPAGLPINEDGEFIGTMLDVFNPYAVLAGITVVVLSVVHGGFFIGLKTNGDIRTRALALARSAAGVAALLVLALMAWTLLDRQSAAVIAVAVAIVGALGVVMFGAFTNREGWAFAGTAAVMGLLVAGWFAAMFPAVMVSSLDPAWSLTTTNASASAYTLSIMSWVALAVLPMVLIYQSWSYWVFRRRIGTSQISADVKQASTS